MRITTILVVSAITVFGGSISVAQTPDGTTPADEGICDGLVGSTPGLYGLCVAYCEAQDLDTLEPSDPSSPQQSPSRRILENYRNKMAPGDPDMPCVRAPCPCWSDPELEDLFRDADACWDLNTGALSDRVSGSRIRSNLQPRPNNPLWLVHTDIAGATHNFGGQNEFSQCFIFDRNDDFSLNFRRVQRITEYEFYSCDASIRQLASNIGLNCQPSPVDDDGDGRINEDPPDGIDNDGDGLIDEDPIP